ncbi:MAG: hypothetical protein H6718_31945 [Polyangiaceae bacterium]|nr:hypothetical protein [Polyangiaceae bacterium]MCB9607950.1 hypothetical protein [Polyangiaceae bacterium]
MSPSQSSSSWALHGRAQASTLRVREAFVKERYGDAGHARLLEHASERLRQVLTVADPSDGWVSFDHFIELCVLIDRLFGRGDHGLILQMGRYSAEHTSGVWKSMFQRGMDVTQFLEIASGLWHRHYDSGRVLGKSSRENEAELTIEEMPLPHRAHCLSVKGWLEGVFSFSENTRVEILELSCRASGNPGCRMRLTWR